MDDLGNLIAGLVKIFVFIIQVAVNIVAEIVTSFLALLCFVSIWKIPALIKCYQSFSCEMDGIWQHRLEVVQCFLTLLLDIMCLPALFFSLLFVWRLGFFCKIWSGEDGQWRVRAWTQFFYGLLDCACVPPLVICIASVTRFYFACKGCENEGTSDEDWAYKWRLEVWLQFFLLGLDLLCLPALFLCVCSVTRFYFLCKGCEVRSGDHARDWSYNWRVESWRQAGFLLLDVLCFPALLLCICSVARFYFLCKGCDAKSEDYDWSYDWRSEAWRQTGFLLLDVLCFPALLLCICSVARFYFLCKGCDAKSKDYDWSYDWRSEAWRQTGFLLLDVLCIPALFLCCLFLWRLGFLFAMSEYDSSSSFDWKFNWRLASFHQLLLAFLDIVYFPFFVLAHVFFWRAPFLYGSKTPGHKAASSKAGDVVSDSDWAWNWRFDAFNQFCFAFFDIICLLPLLFSVLTWRNAFFFGGYRAREVLLKANDDKVAAQAAVMDAKPEPTKNPDWQVNWRLESGLQLFFLMMDILCVPLLVAMIIGPWRIPFFLAGSRSRPNDENGETKSKDHDWAFLYRSELVRQLFFFALDLFFIFPVIICIVSIWRIQFVKEMYEQELKDMASSQDKSDFPGQIRLRCLQQVVYLFLDLFTIPCVVLLLVSFWRWGYVWRGLLSASSSNRSGDNGQSSRWPYDWYGDKRTFLLYQIRCLTFDLLCAPLVIPLVVFPWRFFTFWSSLSNSKVVDDCLETFFPADVITDHPSCWRFKAIKNFVFCIKDILSFPFFLFSVMSWRNPLFFRCFRHEVRYILQQMNAKPSDDSAPSSDQVTDLEISMDGVAANGESSHEPNSIPSMNVNREIVPNTARFLMSSPQQDDSIPPVQAEESAASPVPAVADPSHVSAPVPPTQTASAASSLSPATPVDTLPWFDPVTMDWHVGWRELSCCQTFYLLLDFLSVPFLVFYVASVYRVCIFPLPVFQLISSTDANVSVLKLGYSHLEDWDIPIRSLLLNHTLCIVCDVLCFPFFVIAKISWRGHTLANPSAIVRPAEIPIADAMVPTDYIKFESSSNQLSVIQEAPAASAHSNSEIQLNHQGHSVNDHPSLTTCLRDLFLHQVRAYACDLLFNFAHHSAVG
jgi:hypothetical protein